MGDLHLVDLLMDGIFESMVLFGRLALMAVVVLIAAYLYFRRQERKGKNQRYSWR